MIYECLPGDAGMPGSLARVLADVAAERRAQDAAWGIQDFPDGTSTARAAEAEAAKQAVADRWKRGLLTWGDILGEEYLEAMAEQDPARLRLELIQTAAVCLKWVQAIDRREGALPHRTKPASSGRREKLVRDRIPALIKAEGRTAHTRTAHEDEYLFYLRSKLYEEAGEYIASGDPAELADLVEAAETLAELGGLGPGQLERIRQAKQSTHGGFTARIILTTENGPPAGMTRGEPPLVQTVRAILLDGGGKLILFRRTLDGQAPYWTAPGGRVEDSDPDLESALRRELTEELGAEAGTPVPVYAFDEDTPAAYYRHRFFACRLESMNLASRTGPEFADASKGRYDVERIPATADALAQIDLRPAALRDFLAVALPVIAAMLGDSRVST